MSNENKNLPAVLDKDRIDQIKQMSWEIPFGNTAFQVRNFLREYTPERQLRMILLQLNEKITSLEKFRLNKERLQLDLDELEEKIDAAEGRAKRRLEIDLVEKRMDYDAQIKLVNDALEEIKVYDELLREVEAAVGQVTRQAFEQQEQKYWEMRLLDDARAAFTSNGSVDRGTLQSLQKIGLYGVRDQSGMQFLTTDQIKQLQLADQTQAEASKQISHDTKE